MNKKEFNLSISGNISRDEIRELEMELKSLDVFPSKLETFSAEIPEWINLAFRNFDTINFLRDFGLSALLTGTISKIYKWAKTKKNKKINGVWIVYFFNINGVNFSLNIMTDIDHLEEVFNEAKSILNEKFIKESLKPNSIISFGWDKEKNTVNFFIQ